MERIERQTPLYLDHNATTPIDSRVREAVIQGLSHFGNPSSIHWAGRESKSILRNARENLAQLLNVSPLELIFTSGASEGNNTIIQTLFQLNSKKEFICSSVEHPSVMKTMQAIEARGAKVYRIPVNRQGVLDLDFIDRHCSENTALISVMAANNETGQLHPIKKVTELAHSRGTLVHTDAVQALGKTQVDLKDWGVDYATFSGHKFYALKGIGVLFAKKGVPQQPLIYGGAQERFRRGGTENLIGILSFGKAAEFRNEIYAQEQRIRTIRDQMESDILRRIPQVEIISTPETRLSNTSSLLLHGVDGETLLMALDIKGFAVSTGAACSSGNPEPSPVLLAMGYSRAEAQNSLRVSLGWSTTTEDIASFVDELENTVKRLRKLSSNETVI